MHRASNRRLNPLPAAANLAASAAGRLAGRRRYVQFDAGAFLQKADYAEQIAGLRVAARTEHADVALGRRPRRLSQLFETDGCLDVVSQDGPPGTDIAGEHSVDTFAEQRIAK